MATTLRSAWPQVVGQAWADEEFRRRLLENPERVLDEAELGGFGDRWRGGFLGERRLGGDGSGRLGRLGGGVRRARRLFQQRRLFFLPRGLLRDRIVGSVLRLLRGQRRREQQRKQQAKRAMAEGSHFRLPRLEKRRA